MVLLADYSHKSPFKTINKQLGPIWHSVFLHRHSAVIYSLSATREADELCIEPDITLLSSPLAASPKGMLQNQPNYQCSAFFQGHNRKESWKQNHLGGDETREQETVMQLFVIFSRGVVIHFKNNSILIICG